MGTRCAAKVGKEKNTLIGLAPTSLYSTGFAWETLKEIGHGCEGQPGILRRIGDCKDPKGMFDGV